MLTIIVKASSNSNSNSNSYTNDNPPSRIPKVGPSCY